MGLSAILLSAPCPPPAPMEIQAPWGPPTESLTALHRAGKAQDSHLVHIFLVCSEMTPHCWGEKGRVSRWRSSHMAPRLRSTMGSPVPVTLNLPVLSCPPQTEQPPRSPRIGTFCPVGCRASLGEDASPCHWGQITNVPVPSLEASPAGTELSQERPQESQSPCTLSSWR